MTSALNIQSVKKQYNKQLVLKAITLQVKEGRFVGLVGENGAGKTTLIKCILDFCTFQSGSIDIFGMTHKAHDSRSRLAFLPERFAAPYFVTGRDFLRHMARMHKQTVLPESIDTVVQALGLDLEALDKPVHALSKGMAQKIGLAAVLASNKDLFILDEPMSGLDPKARALLKRYLLDLKAKGKTLFFSTHLLADVEVLCDEMIVLHDGQAKYTGSPAACCEHFETENLEDAYISCIS